MSPRFQAATCADRTARISASSFGLRGALRGGRAQATGERLASITSCRDHHVEETAWPHGFDWVRDVLTNSFCQEVSLSGQGCRLRFSMMKRSVKGGSDPAEAARDICLTLGISCQYRRPRRCRLPTRLPPTHSATMRSALPKAVLDSRLLTLGERVRQFEAEFAAWTGARHAVMVNSQGRPAIY